VSKPCFLVLKTCAKILKYPVLKWCRWVLEGPPATENTSIHSKWAEIWDLECTHQRCKTTMIRAHQHPQWPPTHVMAGMILQRGGYTTTFPATPWSGAFNPRRWGLPNLALGAQAAKSPMHAKITGNEVMFLPDHNHIGFLWKLVGHKY